MPNAPNVDGLPPWLQVLATLAFGLATAWMAFRGYTRPKNDETKNAMIHIADAGTIRHLADCTIRLSGDVQHLDSAIRDLCAEVHDLSRQMGKWGVGD